MTQARIAIANDGSLSIDEQVLANLIDSIGVDATEAQIEIFDLFFESAPQLMAKVSRGANLGAWDQVRADLHALKGSCELFGATQLAQRCKDLEKVIASGQVVPNFAQIAEIQTEFNRVVGYLRGKRPLRANPVVTGPAAGQPMMEQETGLEVEET